MIRLLAFVFSVFFTVTFFAQNIRLNWEGFSTLDYGTEVVKVPFFTNEGFHSSDNTVFISLKKKSTGNDVSITNLDWEKVGQNQIYDLKAAELPTKDYTSVSNYYNKYDNENLHFILVSTLKFENGSVYRLRSFDITSTAKSQVLKNPVLGSSENPLKTGTFYKIKVDKSGIFKITTKFLSDNGINPSSINPKNFRIYGNGGLMLPEHNKDPRYAALQENAIEVFGEEDGIWNDGDYALFYAQGPKGFNLYSAGNGNGYKRRETRTYTSDNFTNIYEDYAYYFINFDLGPGKRVQNSDIALSGTPIVRYDAYQFINEDKFNLMKFGRIWTDDPIGTEKTVTFNLNSPIQPDDRIRYRTASVGYFSQGNKLSVSLNGVQLTNISSAGEFYVLDTSGSNTGFSGNSLTFTYTPDISVNPNGRFYFDYAEVQYKDILAYNDQQMNFRDYSIDEDSRETYSFLVSNTSSAEQIWDVSDITNAKRKVNKSGSNSTFSFGYTADSDYFNNEFVIFKNTDAFTPQFVGRTENQDLSSLTNIDYLMITQTNLLGQAQRIADFYKDKYSVAVVDVNKIYNEFSSGGKDITAIRDFITKLNNPAGTLKYVLLLGDTSYDFKGKQVPGSDIIPSYQSEQSGSLSASFVTDDYFVMTKEQTSSGIMGNLPDIPIGRLPAANPTEAKLLVDKTLAYNNALPGQSTPFGEWRMKMDFVVDDDDDIDSAFHYTMEHSLKETFETGPLRKEYNIRKLYMDAFPAEIAAGGQRFPQVNQAISNAMNNSLLMLYFGHGGVNGWAQERVLTSDEIQNFNNYNSVYSRFPMVSTITCEFTLWDDPETFSAGEQVIKHKTGGAATMITSSRKIAVIYGERFTPLFNRKIFELNNDQFNTLGDAFLQAKITYKVNPDHLRVNFLGDPAGKLSRPQRLLQIDEINSPVEGQLRALDFVKITGRILKADGTLDEGFNGRVAINIFDKKVDKKTLNNDGNLGVMNFKEEGSPVVKSSGTAESGNFTVEFYVPKDINYEIGEGRILAYADNKVFDVFNNQPQPIGGINPDGINDSEAPKAKLYMNNVNFAEGGITDQNPTFLACVTDDTGINSTGSGIGHDITVVLDGEVINTVVLNDFYFSGEGNGCVNPGLKDYQKGNVTYPFRNLKPGPHQLVFKVWDINNNSTTETLNFIVKDEAEQNLQINRPMNWPNPFTNKTYVHFEHNCDDLLDVNVQIYTITGRLVKTIATTVTAEPFLEGYRTPRTAIEWDGTDDFGDAVGKGTYIFKIFARSQNQDKCRGSATAVEKMVLLK